MKKSGSCRFFYFGERALSITLCLFRRHKNIMTQSLILAIDQGGQSSRVAVYTDVGEQLYCFAAPCATSHKLVNGQEYIEQDPDEILLGIKSCIEKVNIALGENVKNIMAAGFAGQGSSLLCWNNKTGEALSPVLSWQDVRGDGFLQPLTFTHTQARELTGLRVSPHYGASKIRWCLDNNIQVRNALKNNTLSIGPIVSYIFWHLTGKNYIDPGHAQRTLLWNLISNTWDASLLNLFNIPRNILPELKWHDSHFGDFYINDHKILFTASARDQGASLFSRGLPDKNACYINIGTGAFIQRVADNLNAPDGLLVSPLWLPENNDEEIIDMASPTCYVGDFTNDFIPDLSLPSGIYIKPEKTSWYAWEATVNGAASAIAYIEQQTGVKITPKIIGLALTLEPDTNCYFLNAVGGLSAPYWRTDLTSTFSLDLTANEKILAWLESIVFQIIVNINLMSKLGDAQKIYISGGLSNADLLCQKIADLIQVAVHRSENADATLQGIACMAGGLSDVWQDSVIEKIFQPAINVKLNKRFSMWQDAMKNWLK